MAGLSAVGLGFLKNDAILWPLMFVSLTVAMWGFWTGQQLHGLTGPLLVAMLRAVSLVAGVVFIHGFPAMQVIWTGVIALIGATPGYVSARRRCAATSR